MNRNKKTAKRAMGMALAAVLLLSPPELSGDGNGVCGNDLL